MHKAFPLPGESSHWQYKFPLPVEGVPTARRMEIPLPGVCTAMMKKLPVKDKWQFPLLSERDSPAEEVCTADEVKGVLIVVVAVMEKGDGETNWAVQEWKGDESKVGCWH
nr:hypothetical protein [Tanacetum cinerariifolium]